MHRNFTIYGILFLMTIGLFAQNRTILTPQRVDGAPFVLNDQEELFGKAYRWFVENEPDSAIPNLKKLVADAGFTMTPENYYVVVANFMDSFSPIGIIHDEETDFFGTRLYGLNKDNLYYVFISQTPEAPSFLSVLATAKDSPFQTNLLSFLNFIGVLGTETPSGDKVWVDVRQFRIPKAFQKFSDLSFIVKKELSDENALASAVFDNTSKESWSYGIAFGLTSVNDVDIIIGSDGRIIIQPKPDADMAVFGVVNYHLKPIDTKAPTFGNSIHLLGGLRVGGRLEPLIGIGGGFDLGAIALHAFVGYSVEFANELKEGFSIGQTVVDEVDPFKTNIRGKPRFGLEVRFP